MMNKVFVHSNLLQLHVWHPVMERVAKLFPFQGFIDAQLGATPDCAYTGMTTWALTASPHDLPLIAQVILMSSCRQYLPT